MGSVVRQIVSDLLAKKLQDPRISRFASVTRVEVSGDLQVAKVYVSVMGSEAEQRGTMRALDHAKGHIQRILAKSIAARHCPELRFLADPSIKGTNEVLRIIDASVPPPSADPDDRDSDTVPDNMDRTTHGAADTPDGAT
jgi:ribosome-binding factor A